MAYSDLTETEQAVWDEYGTLRSITDWDGFSEAQEGRKLEARTWLQEQRKAIWRAAGGDGGDGWDDLNRRARYEQLKDSSLNGAEAKHEYTLPAGGCTPTEKAYIEEREGYLMIGGTGRSRTDDQTRRKTANVDWLVERRKQVYRLLKTEGDSNDRATRYENLCIATHCGKAWEQYRDTHNKYGQEIGADKPSDESSRAKVVNRARSYLGVGERPAGSNRGSPQPSGWQRRVIGSDGYAWCACFTTCMAWDVGVKGGGSAGVQVIVDMAKRGRGMFRGWTTNPARVMRGDFAVVGCSSCHIGLVVDNDDPYHLIEGNTSSGSGGSQYNGGGVYERQRNGQIVGWALVDYP